MDNMNADFEYGMKEAVHEAEMIQLKGSGKEGICREYKEYLAMFEVCGDTVSVIALAEDIDGNVLMHYPDDARICTGNINGQYGARFSATQLFTDACGAQNTKGIPHRSEAILYLPRRNEVKLYATLADDEVLGIIRFFRDGVYVVEIYGEYW